jgi:hypothetical protein
LSREKLSIERSIELAALPPRFRIWILPAAVTEVWVPDRVQLAGSGVVPPSFFHHLAAIDVPLWQYLHQKDSCPRPGGNRG